MKLIVTRPEPEASIWVAAHGPDLQAHGLQVVVLPLMAISAVQDISAMLAAHAALPQYHAVMFVSANAVRFFLNYETASAISWPAPVRAWCTGPGTTAALVKAGVQAALIDAPPQNAPAYDSESLWVQVQTQVQSLASGARVLIVRGCSTSQFEQVPELPNSDHQTRSHGTGREWLAQQLIAQGVNVDYVAVYKRRAPQLTAEQHHALMQAVHIDAVPHTVWMFTSAEAIANLRQLAPTQNWRQSCALVTHPRIAHAAQVAGFGQVVVSGSNSQVLLASIESLL